MEKHLNRYLKPRIYLDCKTEFQPKHNGKKYCSIQCYRTSKKGIEPQQLRRI
jgi:hypothetical protein